MLDYSLRKIAEITGGRVVGNPDLFINGISIDSRTVRNDELFIPIIGEKVNAHDFVGRLFADGLKASLWREDQTDKPDNGSLVIVDNVEKALWALAEDYRKTLRTKIIGVTGSSGKTSTKDMIAAVLSEKYKVHKTAGNQNNEIGVPRTILSIDRDDDYAVVEMGISEIGEMDFLVKMVDPGITVITNIGPAHIMNFKTIDRICEQKCSINSRLGHGTAYYANEAYGVREQLTIMNLENHPLSYGYESNSDFMIQKYGYTKEGMYFTIRGINAEFYLPVLGKHQILNVCSAIAIGINEKVPVRLIQKGVRNVVLTPHRLQIKHIGRSTVIDDCYNSNPSSLTASLETLSAYDYPHKTCVLGDMLELGDGEKLLHSGIADHIDFSRFEKTVLYGPLMHELYVRLRSEGINAVHFDDYEELYSYLSDEIQKDSIILFKASNGMKFINLINRLEEGAKV